MHIEEVTGEDKTVDIVVDIFNRVNSGGTKLSKGDLALAKICAEWPDAREAMKVRLEKWRKAGFYFRLEWLLRCINTILTGEAFFSALKDVDTATFKRGLQQAEEAVDTLLTLMGSRLGLDHDQVLGSRYSFPLLARYLASRGGRLANAHERDQLLYWYVHTFLWGRYAGSTESILNQDLSFIEECEGALQRLINQLRQHRGDLQLHPNDFMGWSRGARFYPLLYMLTRVGRAKDWKSGVELSNHLLGRLARLQVHHIFPKALLYQHQYTKAEANALANLTFLTQDTNLLVSDRKPAEYLEAYVLKHPGAMESHWIPMDRHLWQVERYRDFLATRRALLAQAANAFLNSLLAGAVPERTLVPGGIANTEEERLIQGCQEWVVEQGLPRGEERYEVADPTSGELLAILDVAWPQGIQEGYSQPMALLIDEGQEVEEAANRAGYRYFTDVEAFRSYVQREILAVDAGPS